MANEFAADVLVCGAGAAGLTLALELARRGISFRVIDKAVEPFPGSRGKGIQPRTQEVLRTRHSRQGRGRWQALPDDARLQP